MSIVCVALHCAPISIYTLGCIHLTFISTQNKYQNFINICSIPNVHSTTFSWFLLPIRLMQSNVFTSNTSCCWKRQHSTAKNIQLPLRGHIELFLKEEIKASSFVSVLHAVPLIVQQQSESRKKSNAWSKYNLNLCILD